MKSPYPKGYLEVVFVQQETTEEPQVVIGPVSLFQAAAQRY